VVTRRSGGPAPVAAGVQRALKAAADFRQREAVAACYPKRTDVAAELRRIGLALPMVLARSSPEAVPSGDPRVAAAQAVRGGSGSRRRPDRLPTRRQKVAVPGQHSHRTWAAADVVHRGGPIAKFCPQTPAVPAASACGPHGR
jgi:hypothetical protein